MPHESYKNCQASKCSFKFSPILTFCDCCVTFSCCVHLLGTMSCPVDHSNAKEPCNPADNCPVDHNKRTTLATLLSSSTDTASQKALSQNRVVSSIPRNDEGHWVYPSESQFFAAMARKNHNPEASDMRTIVPIHNAVNERTWSEVMEWEKGRGGEKCGGVKLVTFKGRPGDMSPKARWKCLLGYEPSRTPSAYEHSQMCMHHTATLLHLTDTIG